MPIDTTPHPYQREVAPAPERVEDATADNVARYLACQVAADARRLTNHYYFQAPPGDRDAAREYAFLVGRKAGYYGALMLLRVLAANLPDKADVVARELWADWGDGQNADEWVHEWLTGYGIDAARIIAEVRPVTRSEPAGQPA